MNDNPTLLHSVAGCLDIVSPEGVVEGWCWDRSVPEHRPEIIVTVDGITAGSTIASSFRPDLLSAGIGDGCFGFAFVIPWSMLFQKRTVKIAVFEGASRQPVGEPCVLRHDLSTSIDDRLAELEGRVRLLESRLTDIAEHSKVLPDTGALFRTVGSFFTQLSQDMQAGAPLTGGNRLGTTIEAVETAHPTLTIPVCEQPLLTICIDACAPLALLHGCIASLLAAQAGGQAEFVLLDPGLFEDAALLPVVVRNLRYVRTLQGPAQERNTLTDLVRTPLVAFVSGRAAVAPDWLSEILTTFERLPEAAAVGGCVVRRDGLLERGGLLLSRHRHLLDLAAGRFADDIAARRARAVHALPGDAIVIRREALLACDGLDERYDTVSAAIVDLCLRLVDLNWSVQYQPFAPLAWHHPEPGESATPETSPLSDTALMARWLATAEPPPPLIAGEALIIGPPGKDLDGWLRAADLLQTVRYDVSYTAPTPPDEDRLRSLARHGIAAVPWPEADTEFAQFDIVWAASAEAAAALEKPNPETEPVVKIVTGIKALRLYCAEQRSAGPIR